MPRAVAVDDERVRLFGLTFHGDSFLYQNDLNTNVWSVLLENEKRDSRTYLVNTSTGDS
ncbi:hypothetical protein SAMN05444000_12437 [Shimia gijangensis]|uniref:Uncharacterized protein n=1 Tax=Shimia gijangensis TaxID=1470563 RepID=A0A1M6R7J9_9RHOB|nr:hypothetical protein [Shimia gijangensis]SHK28422.1 hypothetical protein SAMN05444000_12437 [Shimia gijangensis]